MKRATTLLLALSCVLVSCKKNDVASTDISTWPSFDAPVVAKTANIPLPAACTLITAREAAAVLNQEVSLMANEPENCIWASAGNPGQITMFMVQLSRSETPAEAQALFDASTGLSSDLNTTINKQLGERTHKSDSEIEGLGDAAWHSGSNADLLGTETIIVRKGNMVLHISITGMTTTGKLQGFSDRLKTAARTATGRF
jgi:hypothetical protein